MVPSDAQRASIRTTDFVRAMTLCHSSVRWPKRNRQIALSLAVNALRNGIGVFEVARNMEALVQIIQEYYGKQATSENWGH